MASSASFETSVDFLTWKTGVPTFDPRFHDHSAPLFEVVESRVMPSAEKPTQDTIAGSWSRAATSFRDSTSQTRAANPASPAASRRPSGEKARASTLQRLGPSTAA